MFDEDTHSKDIDGWRVSWESLNGHGVCANKSIRRIRASRSL